MNTAPTLETPQGRHAAALTVPAANSLGPEFDGLARLAAMGCKVPFASIALAPGSFFTTGLLIFAGLVGAGAVGLGIRSVRAQVLAAWTAVGVN